MSHSGRAAFVGMMLTALLGALGGQLPAPTAASAAGDGLTSAGSVPVLVAAGDISTCGPGCGEARTAALIKNINPTVVAPLGDTQYSDGALWSYQNGYDRTWGAFKWKTRPAVGNHEYYTDHSAYGYYTYFGSKAGTKGKGYYSYNLGAWHIIALNTNHRACRYVGCGWGSAQVGWLNNDLSANSKPCVLAYWHHPRWSSGEHGPSWFTQALWQTLYNHRADVVLSGHDHDYERFARMDAGGSATLGGVRQFVVGTGGVAPRGFEHVAAHSERRAVKNGVLKMTLGSGSYSWKFVATDGTTPDAGGPVSCH